MNTLLLRSLGLVFLLAAAGAHAEFPYFWMRGEGWKAFNDFDRKMYVDGVVDGLMLGGNKIQGVEVNQSLTDEALVKALNDFYSDGYNWLIPVPFAMKIIFMKVNGVPAADLAAETDYQRLQFATRPRIQQTPMGDGRGAQQSVPGDAPASRERP